MDTQLIIYKDDVWQQIDLFEDVPISLVIQETDITDFQGRKSPYTKQFNVPGTSNNCRIFEEYYEVNGNDFNPLIKISAAVQFRGTDIFNGICRLNSVTVAPNGISFEIFLMGEVGDFISEIKDLTLQQIDWQDLQHELTFDNLVKSWEARNNNVDGLLNGNVLYPLINYGLPYQTGSTTPGFTYAFTGATAFSNSGNTVTPQSFKPALRIKTIIDRIFQNTTYSVQSEFFNSDYFKSIYMDTFQDGRFGTTSASAVTNQNIFKVYTNNQIILIPNSLGPTFLRWQTLLNDGYNPLNLFKLATPTSVVTNPPQPAQSESYFRAPFAGTYNFNVKLTFSGEGNVGTNFVAGQFIARKGLTLASLDTGGNFAATAPIFSNAAPTGQALNWFFSAVCQAGEYVKIIWNTSQSSNPGNAGITFRGFNSSGVVTPAPVWDLYSSPTISGPPLVDFGIGIANIKAIDFFKTLVTMFNLVVIQDENNKTLRIEPYNWYYNDTTRNKKDFTQKLDLNSSYKVEPLSFELSKELNWTYNIVQGDSLQEYGINDKGSVGDVGDYYNTIFASNKGYTFGKFDFISTGNLLAGEQTYEVPFSALPTDVVPGSDYVIIPAVYQLNAQEQQLPFTTRPHLFFWVGNRYCYLDTNKTSEGSWYLLSGATSIEFTTYPCVSHLSSLDIHVPQFVSDLNFGSDFDLFFSKNPLPVQITPFNIYNTFWKDYIENSYSNETRRLSGKFYMTPLDIYRTKLNDKIFVKDAYYRIEKINEADLVSNKLTDIQLIKELGGYYKIVPPSPLYFVTSGQTTYPTLSSPTAVSVYLSTNKASACGNQNLTTVYQYGSGALFNFGTIVSNPSSPTPSYIPQGTYVKDSITNNTYVVINSYGQIIEDPC